MNVQHQLGATPRARDRLRRLARPRPDLRARRATRPPASPTPFNLRPNPAVCRHHADRVARVVANTTRCRSSSSSARRSGLSLLAAYTLGKSTDDASGFFTSAGDPNFPQNSLDPGAEQGRSSFDVRHRLSASFAYALPFGGNVLAASDWRAAGRSCTLPERPAVHGRDPPGHRQQQHRAIEPRVRLQRSAERDRRSVARRPPAPIAGSTPRPSRCRAFGTFGNAGRNILEGPGYQNVNLAVIKHVAVAGDRAPAAARRGVQPVQPHEPRSAGCVLRLADVRTQSCRRAARGGSSSGCERSSELVLD